MIMQLPLDSRILGDIEKITLFLDSIGGNHAEDGAALLALQHKDLTLRRGEIDVFVVFPKEGEEDGWNAGWIGGGQLSGTWVEDRYDVVIDAWLDERIRRPDADPATSFQQLPIFYQPRNADGPLSVFYSQASIISPNAEQKALHAQYLEWLDSDEAKTAMPTHVRTLLGPKGLDALVEDSLWARAVIAADQHGIPPTRTRQHFERKAAEAAPISEGSAPYHRPAKAVASPEDEDAAAKQQEAVEKRDLVIDTAIQMTKVHPLSWKKTAIAIGLGLALGWIIVQIFV